MADTPDMPFPPEPGEAVTHPRPGRGRGLLRLLLMLIAALGGLALSSTHAHAAETTNYGIRPAQSADHFQLELAPGAAALDTAIASNRSGKEMTFKVYAADALTTDQGGFALRARDEPQSGVGQWVKLPVDTVTISAGAQQEVPFRLSLPADASPGDYAGGPSWRHRHAKEHPERSRTRPPFSSTSWSGSVCASTSRSPALRALS